MIYTCERCGSLEDSDEDFNGIKKCRTCQNLERMMLIMGRADKPVMRASVMATLCILGGLAFWAFIIWRCYQ